MKRDCAAIGIIWVVNLVAVATFVAFLPDQVPVHFGMSGEGDRVGSKFENFVMVGIALIFGIVAIADAKTTERSNKGVALKVGIALQVFFLVFDVFIALNQFSADASALASPEGFVNISHFALVAIGVLLIVLGNFMPKATINSTFGFRLPWTMGGDEVWQRSQRLAGYLSIGCGLVLVVCGIVLSGSAAFAALLAVMIAWALLCGIGTYVVSRRWG